MAEFAVGLTKTAVEGTLIKVKSAIEEEARLRVQVQQDLVFITGEFQMMQSFLNVANGERAKNAVVRTWVRQLRDLAFDVEDCVEFVVHLDNKWWASLWRLASSSLWFVPPPPVDLAVAEIKQLKARVEDVSQRNTRYNLVGDSAGSSFSKPLLSSPAEQPAASAFRILNEVWEAAGKRCGTGDLQKLITSEGSDLQVISLWVRSGSTVGAADLGVTGIIRKAYGDPEICQEFGSRAWVKLTHPFKLDAILRSLLTQFYPLKAAVPTELDLVKTELMQHVNKQRYLVVLEDVPSVVEWDAIKVYLQAHCNMGSRIVVSTKQLGIALSCTRDPYQVSELKRFSDDQSVCAFFSEGAGRRSNMGELNWRLRRRGVISVWGHPKGKPFPMDEVYAGIKSKKFDGVKFEKQSKADVTQRDDKIELFAGAVLANIYPEDKTNDIEAIQTMGEPDLLEKCRKFLSEDDSITFINDLRDREDWNLIKEKFLSEPIKGCIVVITHEESVATYCVGVDRKYRMFNIADLVTSKRSVTKMAPSRKDVKDLVTDAVLRPLITGYGPRSGMGELIWQLRCRGVISVWGSGNRKNVLIKEVYEAIMDKSKEFDGVKFDRHSWVDVPADRFDLTDFSQLLLEKLSVNRQDEKTASFSVIGDSFQRCRQFLRDANCLVVINGLRCTDDWESIKANFVSNFTNNCIVVITNEASVAKHCVDHEYRALDIKNLEADAALRLLLKGSRGKEASQRERRSFSNRCEEALDWDKNIELLGRKNEEFKLEDRLKYPGVISVWGIASVGKSALVRSVYYKLIAKTQGSSRLEFVTYSWVDVPHPFNLTEFSSRLLLDFHSDDLQAKEIAAIGIMEGQDPIQGCRKLLREDKCFVVIDGLRSKDDWDLIKAAFLSEPTTGCIVVITNEENVAIHCVDHEYQVLNVKCLDADVAFCLFKKLAWDDKVLTFDMERLSKRTVAKCGGLPKVVAAIGEHPAMPSINLLEYMSDDFMGMLETDPGFHCLKGLFSWMQLYFDACSDSLKPCIFYLSVFPADRDIRRRRLLRRWIAEGYSRDTSGSTAEENGERFFSELVNLSIIQKPPSSNIQCRVNSFFHGYIVSRQMEDNLVFALDGHCSLNSQRAGQHLTVRREWDRKNEMVFKSIDFSRLRSLTVFGEWKSFFITEDIKMKVLRVLDLENSTGVTQNDVDQIGKLLPRLKFLSLRGCKDISSLPSSFSRLKQLQTLDVRHTSIVKLPGAITKLKKLQYIRAGTTVSSDEVDLLPAAALPPPQDGDGAVTSSLAAAPPPPQEAHSTVTSSLPAAETPPQVNGDGRVTSSIQPAAALSSRSSRSPSWLSEKIRRRQLDDNANGGVEVPAGIGKLTALHTLGVINVNAAGGKAIIFKELEKLALLRKLTVSGINRGNWNEFCSAISGHVNLESLSVRLDEEDRFLDDVSQLGVPPKTLKSLKLYGGHGHRFPVWIDQLDNLKKLDLEMNISTREGIHVLAELPRREILHRLCVKPMFQDDDGELHIGMPDNYCPLSTNFCLKVLKIDCSFRLAVTFGFSIAAYVELLVVHCSSASSSSLRFSGLENLLSLKEVWLTGSYGGAHERDLLQHLSKHKNKPVLMVAVPAHSS